MCAERLFFRVKEKAEEPQNRGAAIEKSGKREERRRHREVCRREMQTVDNEASAGRESKVFPGREERIVAIPQPSRSKPVVQRVESTPQKKLKSNSSTDPPRERSSTEQEVLQGNADGAERF
ncbi:UNVERIFIED_CONTAM: hypothetical protein HHA_450270 [Hammondia hammondi]|eukprot:XP_008889248.1 hypothetical protein HHA_450270 [Hammondia hammondi]